MTRAAIIDANTGAVINVIMADAAVDRSPEPNSFLVDAGNLPIRFDWRWTLVDGWILPVPPAPPPVHIPANAVHLQKPADQGPPNVD